MQSFRGLEFPQLRYNTCNLVLFSLYSLFKKPPMNFKIWESKLCDRMNIWYKAAEKDGQELVSITDKNNN